MKHTIPCSAPERRSLSQTLCARLLGLALFTALPVAAQDLNPAFVSSWPGHPVGDALSVTLTGTKAIVAVGEAGIYITEIGGSVRPSRLTTFDTPGTAYSVTVSVPATYAYVADGEAGIQVLSITNLAKPVRIGGYDTSGSARAVALGTGYAYVADGAAGVQILSVTDPANPVRVGGYDTPGEAVGVATILGPEGPRLYVADRLGGLVILNVNNPANPTLLGRYNPGQDINAVLLDGYVAYLSAGDAGLVILSTATANAPTVIASLDTPGYAQGAARAAGTRLLHMADGAAGIQLIDVTTPAVPVLVGGYDTEGVARGVAATPTYSYTADGAAGLQVIRVSTPAAPTRVGALPTLRQTLGVAATGDLAVLANGDYGATVLNVANPAAPVVLGSLATTGPANFVAVTGELAWMSEGSYGVESLSLTNPASPLRLGGYDTTGYAQGLALGSDLVCVADEQGGLQLLSSTNPATPIRLGGYDTLGWAANVAVVGDFAYVADTFNGLVILSVTNPAVPTVVGTYSGAIVYDVAVQGNLAYLAASGSGLHVLDVSNPTNLIAKGSLNLTGAVFRVTIADHYAYLGLGADGVKVVDISNPEVPVLVGAYDTPGSVTDLAAARDYLYVADADWGLTILRLVGVNHAPPVITSQPRSQFGVEGGNANFSAAAVGAEPLSYQWYLNSTPLAGQTNTSLTLTNLSAAQVGNFTLVVTNPLGTATSQVATLTLLPAGSSLGWFALEDRTTLGNWKGVYGTQGQVILGAVTNLTVSFSGGAYFAFATNTTTAAALERPGTLSVTNRISACQFSATTFSVDVTLPLGPTNRLAVYAMEPNGGRVEQVELIDINTGTIFDTRTLSALTNGTYLVWDVTGPMRIRFTRVSGANVLMNAIFVGTTVNQAPSLRAQPPARQTISAGSSLVLGAGADGTPALAFQWSKDGLPLLDSAKQRGSASPVLNVTGMTPSDAGTYNLHVTNALGQVFGATSVVAVAASMPDKARFVMQDNSTRGNWKGVYGTTGHFILGLSSNLPAGMQVAMNNGDYVGFSTNTYDGIALERPDTTSVTNRFAAAQADATELLVSLALPAGTTNRVAFYLMDPGGERVERFELVDASGLIVLDTRTVSGLTNGIYLTYDISGPVQARITRVAGADALLSAIFFGTVSGAAPTLRVQPPVELISTLGSTVVLGAGADGSPALRFQWRRDGVPLTDSANLRGSTSPVLSLHQLETADAGNYSVLVTNELGRVTSMSTRLTVVSPDPAKASFVLEDLTTMGNWKQVYGTEGALIYGLSTNLPAGVQLTLNQAAYFAFSTNIADPVALERTDATSPTNRFSAVVLSGASLTLDADLPADTTNRLTIYCMEPAGGRAERVDVLDPVTGTILDSRFLTTLTNGVYLTWDVNGPVKVRVTRVAGANAVLSGVFLGTASTPTAVRVQPPAAVTAAGGASIVVGASLSGQPALNYEWRKDDLPLAASPTRQGITAPVLRLSGLESSDTGTYTLRVTGPKGQITTEPTTLTVAGPDPAKGRFVMQDATTLGNWKGVYGTEGHLIVGLSTNLPAPEKQVTLADGSYFAFSTNTVEANALERPDTDSVTNRFAACQYDATALLVNVDLPVGVTNRMALYLMEPVSSRTERVELLDSTGLAVLDTRTVSGLSNAVYLVYDVNGPVKVRITSLAGGNCLLSAVFLGVAENQLPVVRTQPVPNVTVAVGGSALLAAGASGTPALGYRWVKDGVPLTDSAIRSGSAKPVLRLWALQPADAGNYALVITNAFGATTSLTSVVHFSPTEVVFSFVQQDATTLGNWRGVYGTLGHLIVGLSTNLPMTNLQVSLNNGATLVLRSNTPDASALERTDTEAVTNRFAAYQFDANALLVTVDLPAGVTNRIAFYLMERGVTRTERFDLMDATGTVVLDSRTVSALSNAVYLVYDVSGPVMARITRITGADAVLSAVFLGATTGVGPTMRAEPQSTVDALAGGRLILGAGMNGAPALTYQWWKDGAVLSDGPNRNGSLKPVLNFGGLQPADAGTYSLVTSNVFGVVTSQTSVVTITIPPPQMVHLTLMGEPGATYLIATSTDLIYWQLQIPPQQVVATPEGRIEFTVLPNAPAGRQFYRGVKQ